MSVWNASVSIEAAISARATSREKLRLSKMICILFARLEEKLQCVQRVPIIHGCQYIVPIIQQIFFTVPFKLVRFLFFVCMCDVSYKVFFYSTPFFNSWTTTASALFLLQFAIIIRIYFAFSPLNTLIAGVGLSSNIRNLRAFLPFRLIVSKDLWTSRTP